MKRVFILCLMVLVFCVGCKEGAPPVSDQPDDQDEAVAGNPHINESISKARSIIPKNDPKHSILISDTKQDVTQLEVKYPGLLRDAEGSLLMPDRGVYLYNTPIAFFYNQKNLLDFNQTYDFDELQMLELAQIYEKSFSDSTFAFYASNQGTIKATFPYSKLNDNSMVHAPYHGEGRYHYAGLSVNSIAPFMSNVTHEQFDLSQQQLIPIQCQQYIRQLLDQKGLDHTPIIVTDVWSCDMDSDQQQDFFIKATNVASEDVTNSMAPSTIEQKWLHTEGLGRYTMLIQFSQTLGTQLLADVTSIIPLKSSDGLAFSTENFITTDPTSIELSDMAYQYDVHGNISLVPIWAFGEHSSFRFFLSEPIVCDLNGDGLLDFCILSGFGYEKLELYLQEDKAFSLLYAVIFGP